MTGEVPYVARMIKKYESVAKQTGSMLFPEIGVESAPADIVAWSLAKHNRTQLDSKTGEVVMSVHKLKSVERVQLPEGSFTNTLSALMPLEERLLPSSHSSTCSP